MVGGAVGLGLAVATRGARAGEAWPRTALADPTGAPLRAAALVAHRPYCFFYPYVSTPCLLLDMEAPVAAAEPAAGDARPAGVGPRRSIVAYSAICPHEWSHPEPEFSPIGYVAPGTSAVLTGGRDRLIVCCSHGSVFDPAAGGRVEQSPARLPLASVVLEWDRPSDGLVATGLAGPTSFDRFFTAFDRERRLAGEPARVLTLDAYSKVIGRC